MEINAAAEITAPAGLGRLLRADATPKDKKGGFALVIRARYLRILAIMLLVAAVINTTGEYVIGKMATDRSKFYAADVVAGLGVVFLLVEVLDLGVRSFAILNVCLAVIWVLLANRAGKLHEKLAVEQEALPTSS